MLTIGYKDPRGCVNGKKSAIGPGTDCSAYCCTLYCTIAKGIGPQSGRCDEFLETGSPRGATRLLDHNAGAHGQGKVGQRCQDNGTTEMFPPGQVSVPRCRVC